MIALMIVTAIMVAVLMLTVVNAVCVIELHLVCCTRLPGSETQNEAQTNNEPLRPCSG